MTEVFRSLSALIQSELKLAQAEFKEASTHFSKQTAWMISFAAIAVLGVLPLLAFFVIGLGRILDDNYWLSSLVVSLLMLSLGGAFAAATYRRLKPRELMLPSTRRSTERSLSLVRHKIDGLIEETKEHP